VRGHVELPTSNVQVRIEPVPWSAVLRSGAKQAAYTNAPGRRPALQVRGATGDLQRAFVFIRVHLRSSAVELEKSFDRGHQGEDGEEDGDAENAQGVKTGSVVRDALGVER